MNNTGKLLTAREAAEYLNCHPQTVYRNNELPCIVIPGIGKRFKVDDLDGYIEHKTRGKIPDNSLYNQSFSLTSAPGFDKMMLSKLGGICEMAKAKTKTRYNFGYGAIYQRKTKKGKIRWYLDYRDASGKRIQKVAPLASTKEEATIALQETLRKEFSDEYRIRAKRERIKFRDFADLYLRNYAMTKKKGWEKADKSYLKAHLIPSFGTMFISEINALNVEKYIAARIGDGVKKSTINREVACLKKMFNKAVDWSYLEESSIKKVKMFSEKDNLQERILSFPEEQKLLKECSKELKPILITALYTGMRKSEVLNLQWENVDFSWRIINLKKTKSGKRRQIPISSLVLSVLLEQKDKAMNLKFVFTNPSTGKPYTDVKKSFKGACRRVGIENFRFHDLRHTFATRLVAKGIDIVSIKSLLGHSSVKVTERYTHSYIEQKRRAIEILGQDQSQNVPKPLNLLPICDMEEDSKNPRPKSSLFTTN